MKLRSGLALLFILLYSICCSAQMYEPPFTNISGKVYIGTADSNDNPIDTNIIETTHFENAVFVGSTSLHPRSFVITNDTIIYNPTGRKIREIIVRKYTANGAPDSSDSQIDYQPDGSITTQRHKANNSWNILSKVIVTGSSKDVREDDSTFTSSNGTFNITQVLHFRYTHDSNGKLITTYEWQLDNNLDTILALIDSLVYDSEGNVIADYSGLHNEGYNRRTSTIYNKAGVAVEFDFDNFMSNKWTRTSRFIEKYDGANHLLGTSAETWIDSTQTWKIGHESKYILDDNWNIIKFFRISRNYRTGLFLRADYYFSNYFKSDIAEKSTVGPAITIYPVPASDNIILQIQYPEKQFEINIYSLSGQKVYSRRYRGSDNVFTTNISIESLTKGMYLLQMTSQNGVSVQKFIKE